MKQSAFHELCRLGLRKAIQASRFVKLHMPDDTDTISTQQLLPEVMLYLAQEKLGHRRPVAAQANRYQERKGKS